jgi:hypothetical protein
VKTSASQVYRRGQSRCEDAGKPGVQTLVIKVCGDTGKQGVQMRVIKV